MKLVEYLGVLRRFWRTILVCTLAGLAVGAGLTAVMKPTYTASTSLFFSVDTGSSAGDLAQGTSYAQSQVQSYTRLATTAMILQPVIDKLKLTETSDSLAGRVTASSPDSTSLIEISVTGDDPRRAASTAQEIGTQLITAAEQLSPTGANGQRMVRAVVASPATVPARATSPKKAQNLAIGLLLGLSLGILQAGLREVLDTRVRTRADLSRVTDSPILGVVPFDPGSVSSPIAVDVDPHSMRAESYRRVRTNLKYVPLGNTNRAICVSSAIPGEGKSTSVVNIARALADAGASVLLIDADLRKPRIAKYLGLVDTVGLTSVLIGTATLRDVIQQTGMVRLSALAAGHIPPNPSELLDTDAMRTLIEEACATYDYVLIDTPPVLPVADATVLASHTAGVLLVVGANRTRRGQVTAAIETVEAANGKVLGLLLNKHRARGQDKRSGYYYSERYALTGKDNAVETRPTPRRAALQVDDRAPGA